MAAPRARTKPGVAPSGSEGALPVAVERAADELYAAPLEAFVERRTALAKELREAGDVEGAKRLAGLRKPSASAWAINQLWWAQRDELEALFSAARAVLTSPQARSAFEARVRRTRDRTRELLEAAGHTATPELLRRVTGSLHALAAAGGFAPDRDGRLVADRDPPGFEAMEGASWPVESPAPEALEAPQRDAHGGREGKSRPDAEAPAPSEAEVRARREAEARAAALASIRTELDALERAQARGAGEIARVQGELAAVREEQARLVARASDLDRDLRRRVEEAERGRARIAALEAEAARLELPVRPAPERRPGKTPR